MKSEILSYVFVSFIIILNFFIIVGDIRHKKIKNKLILIGYLGGILLFLLGFFLGFLQVSYLRDVLVNFFFAFLIAYLFWQLSFWPAGDAKLFALLSFLLPLHYYWKSYLPFFPSMMLLTNIFICVYGLLFMRSFLYVGILLLKKDAFLFEFFSKIRVFLLSDKIKDYLKNLNPVTIGKSFLEMSGMFILVNYVLNSRQVGVGISIKASIAGMILWMLASLMIRKYIADNEVYLESADNLKTGTVPLIDESDRDVFSEEFLADLGAIRAEGLNERQVGLIKEKLKSKGIAVIKIQCDMPFSPWIMVGVLVTIFLSDNVMQFIGRMFL